MQVVEVGRGKGIALASQQARQHQAADKGCDFHMQTQVVIIIQRAGMEHGPLAHAKARADGLRQG